MDSGGIAQIILALATLVGALGAFIVALRTGNKVATVEQKVDASTEVSRQNSAKLVAVSQDIVAVKAIAHETKDNTNGMKTELVNATALLAGAVGEAKGRADMKAEVKADAVELKGTTP